MYHDTKQLQINNHYSTAYHPQTDGQTERINQILEEYLSLYTNYRVVNWFQLLPIAKMVYNNSPSAMTGISPYLADHGYKMNFDPSTFSRRPFLTKSNTIITDIQHLHTVLWDQIQIANTRMAKQYNKKLYQYLLTLTSARRFTYLHKTYQQNVLPLNLSRANRDHSPFFIR